MESGVDADKVAVTQFAVNQIAEMARDTSLDAYMALMAEKRFDATKIHTHTFPLADLPTALRYARERIDDAIKVVVTNRQAAAVASAAE